MCPFFSAPIANGRLAPTCHGYEHAINQTFGVCLLTWTSKQTDGQPPVSQHHGRRQPSSQSSVSLEMLIDGRQRELSKLLEDFGSEILYPDINDLQLFPNSNESFQDEDGSI